jgi:hypothetical protein
MGLGDFLKYVAGEAAVIAQAPLIFAAAVIVVSGLAYAAARWAFGTVISQKDATIASLEARIKLRDDQLANKLQSTPPDEAKSIIQSLEARLNKLAPRRLERDHVEAIANRIGLPSGTTYKIEILHDGSCSDCSRFAADFVSLFGSVPGWEAVKGMVLGPGSLPPTGIGVCIAQAAKPSAAARTVMEAFRSANIKYDVLQMPPHDADVGLLVTAQAT